MKSSRVCSVSEGSIAEEAGIEAGDAVISINGQEIFDVFDYRFLTADEHIMVEVQKPDGEIWDIEIEKDEYEDLGLEFDDPMLDDSKSCTNKCIFCFIDQLPKNMRETLYFKDDDSRLSFLMGNYITMTNMNHDDIARIVRYRMSPINVSVHTTNPELRRFMLNNRFAGDVLEKIRMLVDGGIAVNCQIVLCRGINDGSELDRTVGELSSLYPGINSISVVPVGITKCREGLYPLMPYGPESSNGVVVQVEGLQQRLLEKYGSRVVYLADEFYIMAGRDIPPYEDYEDFPQIENGVGLVASLLYEFEQYLEETEFECRFPSGRTVSIATGVSAYGYIAGMAKKLEARFDNLKINVYKITNCFFGENITVTGLITGNDIIGQLKGRVLGKELLISRSMLRAQSELFLDDITVTDVEKQLGVKVLVVENSGKDFTDKILGI